MLSQTSKPITQLQARKANSSLIWFYVPVFFVALFTSILHIAPFWRAQLETPNGWEFSGNIMASPDLMQYRVWIRQSQETGILVDDKFTSEPNPPYLLVPFYYILGKISTLFQIPPEYAYAYVGSFLAFAFTLLLFVTLRQFIDSIGQVWLIFLVILLGGGLGAHLKLVSIVPFLRDNYILKRTLVEGLASWPVFEDYRGNYVFLTLFDTHYLVIWFMTTASILSLYFSLRKFTLARLLLTIFLFALTTLLNIYMSITLVVITCSIVFLLWWKKSSNRSMFTTVFLSSIAVGICLFVQWKLYQISGLPLPPWRAKTILFSTLMIAFPLAWILILYGIKKYWENAGFRETFLLGWAFGATSLTLSGPFYPYPDRGIITLQIPLYLIAGTIYFTRFNRINWQVALIAVFVLGATPAWMLQRMWDSTTFDSNAAYMFLDADHRAIINLLQERATKDDILITDMSKPPWKTDVLWLAPEYPGRLYCGHFFLTVDYDRKCNELVHFYNDGNLIQDLDFLRQNNIRFVYMGPDKSLQFFSELPGLSLLISNNAGSLFEFTGDTITNTRN
jgi:hypothetical protein